MSDPAIEAAQRVFERLRSIPFSPDGPWARDSLIPAAREALKPIRELHYRVSIHLDGRIVRSRCIRCGASWPCDTARLIYATEELER